jgi:hypothetical protein
MMLGSAIISHRTPQGTVYRSEAHITAAAHQALAIANGRTEANLRRCPDCTHPAYHHTAAGCLANNGIGPICLCEMPRDDVDSHHEDHEERE